MQIKDKQFVFSVPEAKDMRPCRQILCMLHLADNYTLKQLRDRQDLIDTQIRSVSVRLKTEISSKDMLEKGHKNLLMMRENHSAAVAYQQYDDNMWMCFIVNN